MWSTKREGSSLHGWTNTKINTKLSTKAFTKDALDKLYKIITIRFVEREFSFLEVWKCLVKFFFSLFAFWRYWMASCSSMPSRLFCWEPIVATSPICSIISAQSWRWWSFLVGWLPFIPMEPCGSDFSFSPFCWWLSFSRSAILKIDNESATLLYFGVKSIYHKFLKMKIFTP